MVDELNKHALGMGLGSAMFVLVAFGLLFLMAVSPGNGVSVSQYAILSVLVVVIGYIVGYIVAEVYNDTCKHAKKKR